MPQTRIVMLHYDPKKTSEAFGPIPLQVRVGPEDTIQFRIDPETREAQPNCKLRITLERGERFSQSVLAHGPGQNGSEDLTLNVLPATAAAAVGAFGGSTVISTYKCELLNAAGEPIPGLVADGDSGGQVVPDVAGT